MPWWVQLISIMVAAFLGTGFLQFLITRSDNKKEKEKKDELGNLKNEMKEHLDLTNSQWKTDYCDKNAKAIADLAEEVKTGLEDRESKGLQRYEEHKLVIEKMAVQHQKDFIALKDAIQKLTENDSKITASLQKISDKQDGLGEGIMGLSHDKLVYMTDKITARGAITLKEQATLTSIYEPYIKLNGNGDAKAGYKHVMGLKVVSDEEARKMDNEHSRKI